MFVHLERILNTNTRLKRQNVLSIVYGAELRAAELAAPEVCDVDSERMLLRGERADHAA